MTILPKKKSEQESESDTDSSTAPSPPAQRPLNLALPRSHAHPGGHGSPRPPSEEGAYLHHHSPPDGYYHRRYELSGSSSGESSPELPPISKRSSFRSSSSGGASARASKKPPDSSPYYSGYNSADEFESSRRPYADHEKERKFEQSLKQERGFVIKKMHPDGACLFRAVADQVYGDQEMHSVVRDQCLDYMLKNADYYSQYVTEDFEHYINRKRSEHCFGNNIEMQAIAEMYNRAIEVFQYSTEPINIFFKPDSTPIRLSYHGRIHYNSVVDPYKATVGVGLGLAGHKPGHADWMQVTEALRNSENHHIESVMFEDKIRSSDWEATCEAIQETVARESYLTWLREQERRAGRQGAQSTSAACGGSSPPPFPTSPPPTSASSPSPPPLLSHPHPLHHRAHGKPTSSNHRGSPIYAAVDVTGAKSASNSRHNSPLSSRRSSRRTTPSPPDSFSYRGSSSASGSHLGSVRTSPYISPHTSPRGSFRVGARERGVSRSSGSGSPKTSPNGTPPPSPLLPPSSSSSSLHPTGQSEFVAPPPSKSQPNLSRPSTSHSPPPHSLSPHPSPPHPSPPHPSPPHSPSSSSVDFESGRVLSQLPYEYSSFLDLPPSALGLSEWEDDHVLAAVLAASQQEYIDSLKQSTPGADGGL